jgi:hypothetical protein
VATFTRGTALLTLAEVQEISGQQSLSSLDRSGGSWATLLVQKTNELIDWLNGRIKASQVTNAEVFGAAVAYAVCAAIFADAMTESGDRHNTLADWFKGQISDARASGLGAAQIDTDADGTADEQVGPSMPIGWNARRSDHRISGTLGTASGKVTDATW